MELSPPGPLLPELLLWEPLSSPRGLLLPELLLPEPLSLSRGLLLPEPLLLLEAVQLLPF